MNYFFIDFCCLSVRDFEPNILIWKKTKTV